MSHVIVLQQRCVQRVQMSRRGRQERRNLCKNEGRAHPAGCRNSFKQLASSELSGGSLGRRKQGHTASSPQGPARSTDPTLTCQCGRHWQGGRTEARSQMEHPPLRLPPDPGRLGWNLKHAHMAVPGRPAALIRPSRSSPALAYSKWPLHTVLVNLLSVNQVRED